MYKRQPLAPFLFCVASLPYVRELQNIAQSGIATAFFDDTNIVANTENCIASIKFAQEKGPGFGLYPQPAKFKILLGICPDYNAALIRKQQYQSLLGLDNTTADKCIRIHPDNAPTDEIRHDLDIKYGMRVLGSPIGSDNFIKNWLYVAFLKLTKEASILQSSITTLHTQWSLIYYCLRNKVNHLFRTVPPRLTKEFCNNTDKLFKSVMEKNISSDINLSAWTQLKPVSNTTMTLPPT